MRHLAPVEIHEALEGLRTADDVREFERHAAACPACARAWEDAGRFREAAARLPNLPLPDGFAAAIMARLGPARPAGIAWPVAAVAGMAVFSLGLLAYVLATGRSLVGLWAGLHASFFQALKSGALVTGKLLRLASLSLDLLGGLARRGAEGLAVASSFVSPEGLAALTVLVLAGAAVLALGLRRKFLSGDIP